ncbi:hypothetical protein GE21DRAFT_7539 [Neurospora crassa]|uniref:SGS-domain-containing protein n=2 Tax=Neurospora crassa TaxID=5141 RepID=F5HGH3_NEUCR|nr:hypothetical protein NCU01118 [Neurospora crassa OR74A]EAA31789.2 hypothetical protein NCU01118 [Neurospora crassa OR74A]KHE88258.1 hypothetical protein GE21DRAFT_7539 [Neurospora crassa]CAB88599.2 related to SGT1 protein [Neurospora crassa]|eukprot:XP_961025.2 hypothetical protein NCU01118 [Neurospora crassa OR74A]
MSATTIAQKGIDALAKGDHATAITNLDKALESSNSPAWLLARSKAHQKAKNLEAALHDAELAYHAAAERGSGTSRSHMIQAQYRRAVIYYQLGRFADADCCAKWSMLLAEGRPAREDDGVEKKVDSEGNYTVTYDEFLADKENQPKPKTSDGNALAAAEKGPYSTDWNMAFSWRSQALGRLKNLPKDHPGWKVNVTKIPPKPEKKKAKSPEPAESASEDELKEQKPPQKEAPAPGSVSDEKMKLRIDFYQTNQTVTVSLFVKDVKKEDLKVEFGKRQVRISPIPREAAPYVKPGDRQATSTLVLAGEIDPSASRWSASPRKIELVLQKATPGVKWGRWGEEKIGIVESDDQEPAITATSSSAASTAKPALPSTSTPAKVPAYPTSSKSGPKNWDSLPVDDDKEDGQDINGFFKTLYKGSTPEQQRAMMKSFLESNGTTLSTNWDEVKDKVVPTVPPEGVEPKPWNG